MLSRLLTHITNTDGIVMFGEIDKTVSSFSDHQAPTPEFFQALERSAKNLTLELCQIKTASRILGLQHSSIKKLVTRSRSSLFNVVKRL